MLQRTRGHLQQCQRRLVHLTHSSTPFQHTLHTGFWCHGAGDIDLASWWISFTQQALSERKVGSNNATNIIKQRLSASFFGPDFLDFLYPPKKFSPAQKLVARKPSRVQPYHSQVDTSVDVESLTTEDFYDQAAQDKVTPFSFGDAIDEDASISNQDRDDSAQVLSSAAVLKRSEESAAQLNRFHISAFMPPMGLSTADELPTERDLKPLEAAVAIWERLDLPRLMKQGGKRRDIEVLHLGYHEAYEAVLKGIPDSLNTMDYGEAFEALSIVGDIGHALGEYTARYVVSLFSRNKGSAWLSWSTNHLDFAIFHLLHYKKYKSALQMYEASTSIEDYDAFPNILRWLAERSEWKVAMDAWIIHKRKRTNGSYGLWDQLKGLPSAVYWNRAIGLAKFVRGLSHHHPADGANYEFRMLALHWLSRTLRPGKARPYVRRRSEFLACFRELVGDTPKEYTTILNRLIAGSGERCLDPYVAIRQLEDVLLPRNRLEKFLKMALKLKDSEAVRFLIEDYYKYDDGIPTRCVSQRVLRHLYAHNDSKLFHKFLSDYEERYGNDKHEVFDNLLKRYSTQLEFTNITDCLGELFKKYGTYAVLPVETWNQVLEAYVRVNDFQGAMNLFRTIFEGNVRPDLRTFEEMSKVCAIHGDIKSIESYIDECEERDTPLSTVLIDGLVKAYIKSDRIQEAENTVLDTLDVEVIGSRTRMFNHILCALALRRDPIRVSKFFQQMRDANVPVDDMTYAAFIQSFCVSGQPHQGYNILRKLMPESGFKAKAYHYALIMNGFIRTHEYQKVFWLYQQMHKKRIRPNILVKSILSKAATALDVTTQLSSHNEGTPMQLTQAEGLLEIFLRDLDSMHIASKQQPAIMKSQLNNRNHVSNLFERLVWTHAAEGNFTRVVELYEKFYNVSKSLRPDAEVVPSLMMLRAVMFGYYRQEQWEEVERLWHLAKDRADSMSRSPGPDEETLGSILESRSQILSPLLVIYMRSLSKQQRFSEIDVLIRDHKTAGYALSNKDMNVYIQLIADQGRTFDAFRLCEQKLMRGWDGWKNRGGWLAGTKAAIRTKQPKSFELHTFKPNYSTIVHLASALMSFESSVENTAVDRQLLVRMAGITVSMVRKLPRIDDYAQTSLLKRWGADKKTEWMDLSDEPSPAAHV